MTSGPRCAPSPRIWPAVLPGLSPSFSSWTQATQLSWIAEVVVRAPAGLPADVGLADKVDVAARLAARQEGAPTRCRHSSRLRRLRTGSQPARCQRRPAGGRVPTPRRRLSVCVVRARGPGRPALRRRRRAGPPRSVPDREAGGEATDQRGDQGHREAAGLLRPVRLTYVVLGVLVGRASARGPGSAAAVAAPCVATVAVRLIERVKRIGGVVEGLPDAQGPTGPVVATALAHRAAVVQRRDRFCGT